MRWKLKFKPGWDRYFKKFDNSIQQRIMKKFDKMEQPLPERGLVHLRYCVEEVGQYRVSYIKDEKKKTKKIHFVGTHKQYEKWYVDMFKDKK